MEKLLTVEYNSDQEVIELHVNRSGAEYLIGTLKNFIENNKDEHTHLFSLDWGGNELGMEKQNLNEENKLIHHVKIMYWGQ